MSMPLFVGVDAGSSATKCVVLGATGGPIGQHVLPSGFDYAEAAEAALAHALAQANVLGENISSCVSTGYGRQNVPFADRHLTEITCHARGAREWYPEVRNIVDIGGQDTKIIRIDAQGQMADYRMNAKCAAGTGTFLESIALRLGLTLKEIDDLAMRSSAASVVNSYCTVFAGTEVLERIKAGQPRQDISMGLFRSIASRVTEMIASHDGSVAATGGVVAHCCAMVRALEEVLKTKILLPPLPQHAGAYGAALAAREAARQRSGTGHVAAG
ncbi:MAG: acyl-CoA dehydratase activase [Planctomycetota bacterium]|jgi:predicted CoA-substrate-specific enzyme activase